MAGNERVWRRLLNGWMAIVGRFAFVQTLLLLLLLYLFMIGPTSILMALARRDQLAKRGLGGEGSAWCTADTAPPDLERAKLLS
ncbi:MAG: hypothetical protein JRG80_15210 [Deltaproteobacteria bacterium]|nr:hypothetical protein [Deltaproteobacteria bacterium]MBW2400608.1 hypothetical protein [Deltaproteobacteria bacterium]MBW2667137.1 hypothetical protein [Deltaproteobacteria bacterium]